MVRHRGVEHVDTDDAVADHEEEGPDEHDPVARHPGPPDSGGQPEDVDWDSNREDWIFQTRLEKFWKYLFKDIKIVGGVLGSIKGRNGLK